MSTIILIGGCLIAIFVYMLVVACCQAAKRADVASQKYYEDKQKE